LYVKWQPSCRNQKPRTGSIWARSPGASKPNIAAWNAQADEHNQWSELGEDEKVERHEITGTL